MKIFVFILFIFCYLLDVNPSSEKKSYCALGKDDWKLKYGNTSKLHELPIGYSEKTLAQKMRENLSLETYMTSYRYLVVIAGLVSADRLNTFLAHSGAVILLQETDFIYHFSSFLKPWVHYGESIPHLFHCVVIVLIHSMIVQTYSVTRQFSF